jgi:uncharacterized protein YbcI
VHGNQVPLEVRDLTETSSAAMVDEYSRCHRHDSTGASTYINENVVVCFLENVLSTDEARLAAAGSNDRVLDGRVAFQTDTEDAFTAAVERLTGRGVVGFLSANQTAPGIASGLFFLEPPAVSEAPPG